MTPQESVYKTNFQTLKVLQRGPIAHVLLDRPGERNAFDEQMLHEVPHAIAGVGVTDARAIVLHLDSAGADRDYMLRARELSPHAARQSTLLMRDMLQSVRRSTVPVVARIEDYALGLAVGVVGASHFSVAASSAIVGLREARVGVAPAIVSEYVRPKIGETNWQYLARTATDIDGDEAERMRLVTTSCPKDELDQTIVTILNAILKTAPGVQRAMSEFVDPLLDIPGSLREHTADITTKLRQLPEAKEGMTASKDKRQPNWVTSTTVKEQFHPEELQIAD